jgi:exopolyphosphatase / guanosine-5'-triphosphate,3'-diphosphate pyrophosphatase
MIERLLPDAHPHQSSTPGSGTGAAAAAPDPFPIRAAAIDVGTNAIRFLAAEFSAPAAFTVLEQIRTPVRLGHDVFLSGRLAPGPMEAAVHAITSYRQRIEELGVVRFRAVATSAVRDSDNGDLFLRRVHDEAGVPLEVITGAEEVRLVHQAVRSRISLGRDKWVLADLGGGSVEVSLVDDEDVHWSVSHGMGSVRLLEELSVAGDEPGRFTRRLHEYAATLRMPPVARGGLAGFIATGGNIEALARLAPGTEERNGVALLPLERLRETLQTLGRLSYRQRVSELGLREDRADVILPAAMVYERLCTLAGMKTIHVPFVGVKDGILFDLVDDHAGHEPHRERQDQVVCTGALALGKRYRFDIAHGRHVAALSLSVFDQLRQVHGLDASDRRLLMAAALLHDIGVFISHRRHHRHSLYIISQSELPGLNPIEIRMVANIARYHRKGGPSPHHEEFAALGDVERERVTRLAALLRLADALDREHRQNVRNMLITVGDGRVTLDIEGSGDLLLERWAVQRKANLFEQTFGMAVRLRVDGGAA